MDKKQVSEILEKLESDRFVSDEDVFKNIKAFIDQRNTTHDKYVFDLAACIKKNIEKTDADDLKSKLRECYEETLRCKNIDYVMLEILVDNILV